jgi:metal-responsive CopG/Arc/MetJ family transcriptional regulator
MRVTVELKPEQRSRLLAMAARRGEKGFSSVLREALNAYLDAQTEWEHRRKKALALQGCLKASEAKKLRERAAALRKDWR